MKPEKTLGNLDPTFDEAEVKRALSALNTGVGSNGTRSNLTDDQENELRRAFEYALQALRRKDCDLALQAMQDTLTKEPQYAVVLTVGPTATQGLQRTVGALMDHWSTPVAPSVKVS